MPASRKVVFRQPWQTFLGLADERLLPGRYGRRMHQAWRMGERRFLLDFCFRIVLDSADLQRRCAAAPSCAAGSAS